MDEADRSRHDTLGRTADTRKRLGGIPASLHEKAGLDEPEWRMAVLQARRHQLQLRNSCLGLLESNTGAVPHRVGSLRHHGQELLFQQESHFHVSQDFHPPRSLQRQEYPAAFWCRGLALLRLCERSAGWNTRRRFRPLRLRHHTFPSGECRAGAASGRMGPHQWRTAQRQAKRLARRHLVHTQQRHLANSMARTRQPDLRKEL